MKRFSIIFLGSLAIMMAGCSKDVHTASKEPVSDDWLVNVEFPVPIEFGTGSIQTKASFDSMDDLLTVDGGTKHSFGVYAIDKATSTIEQDDLLLDNHRAYYLENTDGSKSFTLVQKGSTGINPDPQYYPMVSEKSYDFYGYYARKGDSEITGIGGSQIMVNVPVGSSKDDILWAKASTGMSGNDYNDGYNARYIRKNPDDKPTLNFKHVTSCLKFKAIYAPNEGETEPDMSEIKITALKIKSIPTQAQLCVIDVAEPENASQLFPTGDATDVDINGALAYQTNLIASKDGDTYVAADLCDDFFIAPQDEALEVQFTIKYTPATGTAAKSQTVTYTLDPSQLGADKNDNGQIEDDYGNVIRLFEAGYQYGFSLKIYSPEEISIDVTIESYKNAFGDDGFADIVIE